MAKKNAPERVLFVHAHPDDESLTTGGTIARLTGEGAQVTVVTATRGELGEVVPGPLKAVEGTDALIDIRLAEMAAAMEALGVTDHRFLGDPDARVRGLPARTYRDSGMMWVTETTAGPLEPINPECLCAADVDQIAADLLTVIDDIRPTAVVSYDRTGGYGHPDHVRVHDAAVLAARAAEVPYYAIEPESELDPDARSQGEPESPPGTAGMVGAGTADADVIDVDVSVHLETKRRAMAAHGSQLTVDGGTYTLSGGQTHDIATTERFRRIRPPEDNGPKPSVISRIGACVLALLVGAAFAALGTVAHQTISVIGGVLIPWGLVLGILAVTALLVGLRLVLEDRLVVLSAAIGVWAVIGAFSQMSAGGSVLIPNNILGIVWTVAPTLIATVVVAWPRIPARRD